MAIHEVRVTGLGAFHPHRTRTETARNAANIIFKNIVSYAKEL